MILSFLLLSAATASAQRDVLTPLPKLERTDRQTPGGANSRAMEKTDSVPYVAPYRQYDAARPNTGTRGRVNATEDAARSADFPSLPPPPTMSNY